MSVLSVHPVHHDLLQHVGGVDFGQDGFAAQRQDGLPHQLVLPHEAHHLVREVLGGLVESVVRLAGTLTDKKRIFISMKGVAEMAMEEGDSIR